MLWAAVFRWALVGALRNFSIIEFNGQYIEKLEKAGMIFSGKSIDGRLVEVIELADHPWFLACQFHPEFTSTPRKGHPLFSGFVAAATKHKKTN